MKKRKRNVLPRNVRVARGWKRRGQPKTSCWPAFQRRALDRTCLSRFQSRWTCPRSCSGGPSKVRGRGLVSGSCQGAVAEAGLVDEAYRVRSSWVVA
ncbi:hypothetical protein MTO96_032868 [Rhipicephalus appendiculatus]